MSLMSIMKESEMIRIFRVSQKVTTFHDHIIHGYGITLLLFSYYHS